MSNINHKTELNTLVNELMTDIDSKPLHPRNKLLVTWVIENIDPVLNQYIRKWLEIPISGTLTNCPRIIYSSVNSSRHRPETLLHMLDMLETN
ncbi:Hypothetical predicted protein, partial [Paramuricea clavata]